MVDVSDYSDRLRPAGIFYVDVYAYHVDERTGERKYLLLRRREDVVLADDWQAISGKILPGERIADAFFRQVRKKTGFEPKAVYKLQSVNTFFDDYYNTVMLVPQAIAELPSMDVALDESLHNEYAWASPAEAGDMFVWESQRIALRETETLLKSARLDRHRVQEKTE